jgi:pyrroloquinoline quinone biosynthesis protein B
MQRFAPRDASFKDRVRFIHMNHTNPALIDISDVLKQVQALGFDIAKENERICLSYAGNSN